MEYLLVFTEGIITFVSPCILPMLPIYVSFFAGDDGEKRAKNVRTVYNACAFVLGMALVFTMMGAAAGALSIVTVKHKNVFDVLAGLLMIIFGLNYLGVFKLAFLNKTRRLKISLGASGFFSCFLFGLVFSVGWTPCIGPLLGSALVIAAGSGSSLQGVVMLALFSLGLGLPFIISAVLLDSLKQAFEFLKRHHRIVNIVAGSLLCFIGILMALGFFGAFTAIFTRSI
ncbi:MAG: cytochrome c biogenesis protein CcdA [Clostridiales bacterium]|nr:cytochrome c biogenesis protein CcdA [Clostridiales bacterium]